MIEITTIILSLPPLLYLESANGERSWWEILSDVFLIEMSAALPRATREMSPHASSDIHVSS